MRWPGYVHTMAMDLLTALVQLLLPCLSVCHLALCTKIWDYAVLNLFLWIVSPKVRLSLNSRMVIVTSVLQHISFAPQVKVCFKPVLNLHSNGSMLQNCFRVSNSQRWVWSFYRSSTCLPQPGRVEGELQALWRPCWHSRTANGQRIPGPKVMCSIVVLKNRSPRRKACVFSHFVHQRISQKKNKNPGTC